MILVDALYVKSKFRSLLFSLFLAITRALIKIHASTPTFSGRLQLEVERCWARGGGGALRNVALPPDDATAVFVYTTKHTDDHVRSRPHAIIISLHFQESFLSPFLLVCAFFASLLGHEECCEIAGIHPD